MFFIELCKKIPSSVNRYEDNKDLKNVFPLFGYEANQNNHLFFNLNITNNQVLPFLF